MMLVPRRNSDLWEDFFNDSFFSLEVETLLNFNFVLQALFVETLAFFAWS